MAWLMSVLGAALALAGAVALAYGSQYIRLDWGQAETVAGTVALAGGLITLALGTVLFGLRDLARAPARAATSGVGHEVLTVEGEAAAPRPGAASRLRNRLATVGLSKEEPGRSISARGDDGSYPDPHALREPAAPPFADPGQNAAAEASRTAVPPMAEGPTVVGRYEANGASYVLFSDGTIEVETGAGTHRFASMADLRDHIERQDAP